MIVGVGGCMHSLILVICLFCVLEISFCLFFILIFQGLLFISEVFPSVVHSFFFFKGNKRTVGNGDVVALQRKAIVHKCNLGAFEQISNTNIILENIAFAFIFFFCNSDLDFHLC